MEEPLSLRNDLLAPTSCNALNLRLESAQPFKKRKRQDYERREILKTIEARVSAGVYF